MNEADKKAHPWPLSGWLNFRFRKATWCVVRPWYGYNNTFIPITAVRFMFPVHFWLPFLTIRTKWWHWYCGWKPISLDDPGFYWRDLDVVQRWRSEGRQFVQLSWRWGVGAIS